MATDTLCGDCPHCAHWQGGHYCERHREFLRYGDDQPLRCEACVSDGRGDAEVSETPDTDAMFADLQRAIDDTCSPPFPTALFRVRQAAKKGLQVARAIRTERDALKARVAELVEMQNVLRGRLIEAEHKRAAERAHPTITRETLIADVVAHETQEEQARAIWWLREVADEAADTLGLTYAEPCAGDGCDGVALDSTESALCAECAAERGLGA